MVHGWGEGLPGLFHGQAAVFWVCFEVELGCDGAVFSACCSWGERFRFAWAQDSHYCALMARQPRKKKKKALLLGVGLDSDGHQRVTTGPNFALVGGTQETHEAMTEKAVKINEKLTRKGKTLDEVSREEFDDIAHEVGLKRMEPPQN